METTEASMLIQKLLDRKKQIAIGTLSVFAGIALLIGYFQSGPCALSYTKAEEAFTRWQEKPADTTLYAAMKSALQNVPALKEKYEATIAQMLISTEKVNEALLMASHSIQRVKDDIPFHAAYAETSLLIEQGKFQEALEKAVALKEEMGLEGSLLNGHNLIRIACLQQELKNRPGEKAAWEEVETFLQSNSSQSKLLLSTFSEKQTDLSQYIAERKTQL